MTTTAPVPGSAAPSPVASPATAAGAAALERLRTWPGFRPAYIFIPPGSVRPDAGWAIWVTTEDDGTTPAQALARRFQNENPGAPHPETLEQWKPDPNSPEPPLPEMAQ